VPRWIQYVAITIRATRISIIEKEILPGTTIMSDEWKPYKVLQNKGYNHY